MWSRDKEKAHVYSRNYRGGKKKKKKTQPDIHQEENTWLTPGTACLCVSYVSRLCAA